MANLSSEDLSSYLNSVGFNSYSDIFIKHEIIGDHIPFITESHLKEIGIRSIGHRILVLIKLKSLYEDPTLYNFNSVKKQAGRPSLLKNLNSDSNSEPNSNRAINTNNITSKSQFIDPTRLSFNVKPTVQHQPSLNQILSNDKPSSNQNEKPKKDPFHFTINDDEDSDEILPPKKELPSNARIKKNMKFLDLDHENPPPSQPQKQPFNSSPSNEKLDEENEPPKPKHMGTCRVCQKLIALDRLATHENVCQRIIKKNKPEPTPAAATPEPTPPSGGNDNVMYCPHCQRKIAKDGAKKHMTICERMHSKAGK